MQTHKTLRLAGVVAALAAAGAVIAGGTVATANVDKGLVSTIKIKGNNQPRFDAPETVTAGADLQILNKTDPQKIGPHSFSLVEKQALPRGRDELRRCGRLKGVCKDIVVAHEVDLQTFEVGEPDVERGLEGWDAVFDGGSQEGDTWFTEAQNETTSRQVTAGAGNLWFMCVIHANMQGKVKVLPAG